MFTDFYYVLKKNGVPVSMNEWYTLLDALEMGLAGASLTGFYQLCRAVLVKTEAHYDRFDLAFSQFFFGVETPQELPDTIWDWLDKNLPPGVIDDEMREKINLYDLDTLKKMLEERLGMQHEEHNGGSFWIGTGGTSPFGHGGFHPGGIRIGGESHHKSAIKVAGERNFRDFRTDTSIDTRQFQMALRKLKQFTARSEGPRTELDLDATVEATGKNAGRLELIWDRPRDTAVKVLLLIDSGGSMTPYARLCNQLFHAAKKSKHFKDLQVYFFHNCIYDYLFNDPIIRLANSVETNFILRSLDPDCKVFLVGDASMAPSELSAKGGVIDWNQYNEEPGINWLRKFRQRFEASVWLNPEPAFYWSNARQGSSVKMVRDVFPMFELTVEGLDMAVRKLRAPK